VIGSVEADIETSADDGIESSQSHYPENEICGLVVEEVIESSTLLGVATSCYRNFLSLQRSQAVYYLCHITKK